MRKVYEINRSVWYFDHDVAERAATKLACAGHEVEMQHLCVERNLPHCLPEYVARISRLDVYTADSTGINRKTCNIF